MLVQLYMLICAGECNVVQCPTVQCIIQFLKVMYLILTLQVPLTLPSVFSKTDSVISPRRHPEVCIKQYMP